MKEVDYFKKGGFMMKRKYITAILSICFVMIAGILYSCDKTSIKEESFNLENQTADLTQTDQRDSTSTVSIQGVVEEPEIQQETNNKANNADIYIHICGEVNRPDVYKVEENTRLIDVINLAGGLTKDAAGDYVNQAATVSDGQRIYIPSVIEVEVDTLGIELLGNAAEVSESVCKININTATIEELMTLTGIGKAKAESIHAYRQEYGDFTTIEEIKNIDGIKDAVFRKISDMITVK